MKKNLLLGFILIITTISMIFVFSNKDGIDIYKYLPEGKYDVRVISVRVKGGETLSEILHDNEDETGMKGVPINVQVKEWERFSSRDANHISAGEDILIPCYIKK